MSIIDPNIKNSLEQLYTSGTLNDFKSLYIYENRVNIPLSKNINRLQKEQLYDYLKTQYRDDEFFTLTEINNLFDCISFYINNYKIIDYLYSNILNKTLYINNILKHTNIDNIENITYLLTNNKTQLIKNQQCLFNIINGKDKKYFLKFTYPTKILGNHTDCIIYDIINFLILNKLKLKKIKLKKKFPSTYNINKIFCNITKIDRYNNTCDIKSLFRKIIIDNNKLCNFTDLAQNYSHLLITEAIENPTTILNINKNILTTIHTDYHKDPLDITGNLNDLLLGIYLFDYLHEFYDFLFEITLTFGFIHNDLHGGNFLISHNSKKTSIYLIDFGLAKKYINLANYSLTPFKNTKSFIGTYRYSSLWNHKGFEQTRRDDLESLCYVLLDLYEG